MVTAVSTNLRYKSGYKYQLYEDFVTQIDLQPPQPIQTRYITFKADGVLTLKNGYAWDGPSGPTVDTDNFMRGSLVHDALYQLIQEGHLPTDPYKAQADYLLRDICTADGMNRLFAWLVHKGVSIWGKSLQRSNPRYTLPVPLDDSNAAAT